MKKILFISHEFSIGGSTLAFSQLIRFFHSLGFDGEIITQMEGPLRDELNPLGYKIYVVNNLIEQYKLLYTLKDNDYNMVFCNSLMTFYAIQTMESLNYRMPVFWWIHEGDSIFARFKEKLPEIDKLPINFHILAVSPQVSDVIYSYYSVRVTDILPIYSPENEPDSEAISFAENYWNSFAGNNKLRLICIGPLGWIKGQDILSDALLSLEKDYTSKIYVTMVLGSLTAISEVYEKVNSVIQKYHSINLISELPHSKLMSLVRKADFLVAPSREDTLSSVSVEALTQKTPIIISDACGISGFISRNSLMNDFIFRAGDVTMLADKIRLAAGVKKDIDSYLEYQIEGTMLYSKAFSLNAFTEKIAQILSNI